MNNIAARQRFGQPAPLPLRQCLFLRRLGGLRCRRRFSRRFRLGLRRLDLFELEFELLQFAPHALRRGAEGHALQARDLGFQLFGFKRLQQKASLGGGKLDSLRQIQRLELLEILGKVYRVRHAERTICFAPLSCNLGCKTSLRRPPVDAFEQHGHLRRGKRHRACLGQRPDKAAFLQTLVTQLGMQTFPPLRRSLSA